MDESTGKAPILVVEDDEGISNFLALAINDLLDRRVVVAGDGETALGMIGEEKPAAILLDIMLPGMSGIAVFDELRSKAETAGVPVIFMSCLDGYWSELRKRGAKSFLPKPFSLERLVRSLNESLQCERPVAA